jgi:hypothetical protein
MLQFASALMRFATTAQEHHRCYETFFRQVESFRGGSQDSVQINRILTDLLEPRAYDFHPAARIDNAAYTGRRPAPLRSRRDASNP